MPTRVFLLEKLIRLFTRTGVVLALALSLPVGVRAQITVTPVANSEGTDAGFKGTGPANGTITIMVQNNPTVGGFTTYMNIPIAADGTWSFKIPKGDYGSLQNKGMVIISSPGQTNVTTTLAAIFMPGQNTTVTALAVLPGSTATTPAGTFALNGSFATEDTNVVYDSTSPEYGNLTGLLLASDFNLNGSGPPGTLSLALNSDQTYEVNLLPSWDSPDFSPNMIAFSDIPISGTATANGLESPFSGTTSGTITFLDNNQEDTTFTFNLTSQFGSIGGTVNAEGTSTVVPEPSSIALTLVWIVVMFRLGALNRVRKGAPITG